MSKAASCLWRDASLSSGGTSRRSFSTSVSHCARSRARVLPRPPPTRPASQQDTPIPKDVVELIKAYPQHPLLAFFKQDTREVPVRPGAKEMTELSVPVTLREGDLRRERDSRSWLAPELRTKSSLELHQLWYNCLMERNRVQTAVAEARRTGIADLLIASGYSGLDIDRRVRKTMARVKFVLNERRLALLEAQRTAEASRKSIPVGDESNDSDPSSLYEDVKSM